MKRSIREKTRLHDSGSSFFPVSRLVIDLGEGNLCFVCGSEVLLSGVGEWRGSINDVNT